MITAGMSPLPSPGSANRQSSPLIAAMAVHTSRDFRKYAAAALGEIGVPAIDALIDGMASDDRELRGFLSQALCRIGKPAVEPLTRRLGDDNEVIQSVLR